MYELCEAITYRLKVGTSQNLNDQPLNINNVPYIFLRRTQEDSTLFILRRFSIHEQREGQMAGLYI